MNTLNTKPVRRRKQFTRGTLALYNAGSSPTEVARLEGVSQAHVTKVCKGESKSARIQQRIELITGKSWDEIMGRSAVNL